MTFQVIQELVGQTAVSVENVDKLELVFHLADGRIATFYHEQECCEYVYIEDVTGDLQDLVGSEILQAEYVTEECDLGSDNYMDDVANWTFYKFATYQGSVTVRWYGTSNGYYSTAVNFRIN